ncbi:MAG: methionyl-tRNA formyltransferase, partial [Prevotella sp.]|nr:methionyl-tRNA formyltransferase [Prevotella sp.]
MEKESLRIVFMGTPVFAVKTLEALIDGGYNVVA